jgi:hypothetical protein
MVNRRYFKREYLFIAATTLACVICYQLAFKKTIIAWQLNKQLKAQLAQSSDVSIQPGYTARKNANLDRILDLYTGDSLNFRSITISKIALVAEAGQVKLAEVPYENRVYSNSKFLIQKLNFEGDYFSLMKVFQQLGQRKEAGIIRSAAFRAKRGTDSEKEKKLIMELYFETIK